MRRESRGHTARTRRPYGREPADTIAHGHARTQRVCTATSPTRRGCRAGLAGSEEPWCTCFWLVPVVGPGPESLGGERNRRGKRTEEKNILPSVCFRTFRSQDVSLLLRGLLIQDAWASSGYSQVITTGVSLASSRDELTSSSSH